MPNQTVMTKWVTALRSGQYEQTRGRLTGETHVDGRIGYCCLGVLCDLAEQEGIVGKIEHPKGFRGLGYFKLGDDLTDETNVATHLPPPAVAEWAGFGDADHAWSVARETLPPEVRDGEDLADDKWIGLAYLNDQSGWTFGQIADLVEKEYIGAAA